MKTRNKLALLAAFGLALAGMSVIAQSDEGAAAPNGTGPNPRHARFGQVLEGLVSQYDANKDGQLDATEMATLKQAAASGQIEPPGGPGGGPPHRAMAMRGQLPKDVLEKYDADKDGTLGETEREALRKDVQDGTLPPPHMGRGARGPQAPPTAQQILERFDADQDGKLDATELTAFLESTPPPGTPHRRGAQ